MDAIVAVYSDWGIGAKGTQPVVLKADRRHFRELTEGCAVIVGRKTLEDFPNGKPLKNRKNIVITKSCLEIEGAAVVRSVEDAAAAAEGERCLVIGGASVFSQFFPLLDRVYITKIDLCPESDSFFPDLDAAPEWTVTEDSGSMEENGIRFRFVCYERRGKA